MVRTSATHSATPRVPLFCSYHILTSSVIYYWTDARQHGIYLLIRHPYDRESTTCQIGARVANNNRQFCYRYDIYHHHHHHYNTIIDQKWRQMQNGIRTVKSGRRESGHLQKHNSPLDFFLKRLISPQFCRKRHIYGWLMVIFMIMALKKASYCVPYQSFTRRRMSFQSCGSWRPNSLPLLLPPSTCVFIADSLGD